MQILRRARRELQAPKRKYRIVAWHLLLPTLETLRQEITLMHWQLSLSAGAEAAWLGKQPVREELVVGVSLILNYSCIGYKLVNSLSNQADDESHDALIFVFPSAFAQLLINTGSRRIAETYGCSEKLFSASACLHSGDKKANLHVEEVSSSACLHTLVFGWINASVITFVRADNETSDGLS